MDPTSRIYICPSFNTHDIADIADRVVQELRINNQFGNDNVFTFSDDENPTVISNDNEVIKGNHRTQIVNRNENVDVFSFSDDENPTVISKVDEVVNTNNHTEIVKRNEEDEQDFEFPVVCSDLNPSVSADEVMPSDGQISLRYPVFDLGLLSETDLNLNSSNGVDSTETEKGLSPRPSLRKLFSEDRDSPSSSSEGGGLDGITPGTYCAWKPKPNTETPRGRHKKSNSISIGTTSKKWRVKDLLKRSYSDDGYSTGKESPVVVFLPPISPKQKTNGVKEYSGKVGSAAGKTERNIPAYKKKIGNIRIPPYLPYRQDQVAAFGNFTGSSKNLYRY